MRRRKVLKYMVTGGFAASLGGGYHWLSRERTHADLALDLVIDRLNSLSLDTVETTGAWEVTRTLNHLAQSVEFSMTGYPLMKSELFQQSAGKLAFSIFNARGQMTHALDEQIPGEIIDSENGNSTQARLRLVKSLEQFIAREDTFHPHFAYGDLNKNQYALAHAMHVNNHLQEFKQG